MASNALSSATARLHLSNNVRRLADMLPLPPSLRQNPRVATAALVLTALGLSVPALSYAAASYRGFLALGPGGIPHNVLGWAMQGLLQLVASWDTRDPSPFTRPRNRAPLEPHGSKTYLPGGPIPQRAGARPDVPGYVAPQRQMDQRPADPDAVRRRMTAFLEALAARNPAALRTRPSRLEGVGTPALWVGGCGPAGEGEEGLSKEDLPPFMRGLGGETAHVHPECSSHVTLSMADAEEVVRKGWAERHRLSGLGPLPWAYVLVYAPRDNAEFEVWADIMRAGVRYVCAGADKEVDVAGE